jgi:cytosine/adenosine deaminase-related metal-dependent hydrolase
MTAVLIRGGYVLTAARAGSATPHLIRDGAVVIDAGVIIAVGTQVEMQAQYPLAQVRGGVRDIVTPGFVNTHGHFSEGLITGIASQYTLWEWVHSLIIPVSPHLTREMAYVGTTIAGIQMLRSGITTSNDMFVSDPGLREPITPGVVAALDDLNIRGVVSFGAGDVGTSLGINAEFEEHDALLEAARASRMSTFRVGVMAVGGQSDEMFQRTIDYANSGGHGVHIHLQEIREEVTATMQRTGRTAIGHCANEGLFAAPTLAAHCVWVDRADREMLAQNHVGVAHNPVANMILASGVAPVVEMRALGIEVGLGVDGPASNDSQDMLQTIKSAALLARVHQMQATAMTAQEAFEMATIGGAHALEMGHLIGSLEPGKAADVVVFDGDSATLSNIHDPYQGIVFVAGSREVSEVWVDGRLSVERGEVITVDVGETVARSRPLTRQLMRDAGLAHLSLLG